MKSIVLLSGGLDSTVNLAKAVNDTEVMLALTFDYGQRAADREITAAGQVAAYYRIPAKVLELGFLKEVTKTALVNLDEEIPEMNFTELDSDKALVTARQVWVPNRNGLFINIAACYAESLGCQLIVTGFNAEEAATFPDNSPAFIEAVNSSLSYSTLSKVNVLSYTQDLDKTGIIKLGRELDVPFDLIWSCYYGDRKMCGRCESCRRLIRAKELAGVR
jgi:7-cyano-7-deazaguanine synthase